MIYFYQATMKRGSEKIRGRGTTLQMVQEWVKKQQKEGFILIGRIEVL